LDSCTDFGVKVSIISSVEERRRGREKKEGRKVELTFFPENPSLFSAREMVQILKSHQ